MVKSCAAYNCSIRWRKGSDISFHSFPLKKPELLKKWTIAIKRKNFVPTTSTYLCSKHFTSDDYTEQFHLLPLERRNLKNDAVPTIFNFPTHMQHSVPKKRRTINRNSTLADCTLEEAGLLSVSSSSVILDAGNEKNTSVCNELSPAKQKTVEQGKLPLKSPTKVLLRRKVKILQQRLKRRDAKIKSMQEMILVFKKKLNAPERLIEVLEEKFCGFPLEYIVHSLENSKRSKFKTVYSEKMKEFALTVYFYSPKAYKYLRSHNFLLPNPSTLRRWLSAFNCSPGFLEEVFKYLKVNVEQQPHLKHVNLVFDAMSIRKQVLYDHKEGKNIGYVSLGNDLKLDEHETLASEALVFQIVSLRGHFKCAVGYFFIDKIGSEALSKLIKMCIVKLYESGVTVHNVTFDGTTTNVSAVKKLGCKLPEKPFFNVKINQVDLTVCVMLDACHMVKLARNTLVDKGKLNSKDGVVDFKYIQRLNDLQKQEGLKFANSLSDKHIHYQNNKMNVKLAAQTLSEGVADAIDFLMTKRNPDFIGAKATVEFIRVVNKLFDYFNSRDPFGKHLKEPIKKGNITRDTEMLNECLEYLKSLTIENLSILQHPRKTFALGFMTNIYSIIILTSTLLDDLKFKYILTYKFSQDHLELLFSCIRSRGGHNNNPNVKQFQLALRKLMFRNSVQSSKKGNCLQYDSVIQSSIMSFAEADEDVDLNIEESEKQEITNFQSMVTTGSYYKDNVLYYISGFIVRKLALKVKCEECLKLLTVDECNLSSYTHFTDFVSRGKLVRASSDVLYVVKIMNNKYSLNRPTNYGSKLNTHKIILEACRILAGNVFKGHVSNVDFGEDTHEMKLIKSIGSLFFKIICFSRAKEETLAAVHSKVGIRQKLTKLVLFSNV